MNREDEQRALAEGLAGPSRWSELEEAEKHWDAVTGEDIRYCRERNDICVMVVVAVVSIAAMLISRVWWLSLFALISASGAVMLAWRTRFSWARGGELKVQLAAAEARVLELQRDPYSNGEAA